jgi:Na+/serine symporter
VTDPVALAIVGAVSTAAAAIIAGYFKLKELALATKASTVASERSAVESQKAVVAVVASAPEPEKVHAAINEFDALRADAAQSRAAAAERLAKLQSENT